MSEYDTNIICNNQIFRNPFKSTYKLIKFVTFYHEFTIHIGKKEKKGDRAT